MPAYSPGAPRGGLLEIGVALVLQDRFSQPAREANRSIKQLHNDAKAVVSANISMAQQLTNQVGRGVQAAWSMVTGAINQGAMFIDTMTTVRAITRSTSSEFDALVEKAQSLGYKTMFKSQDIASGMKYLAMAGHSAQEIQEIINSATNVAGATGLQLGGKGGTADLLTNVMRTFQVTGERGAEMIGDELVKATLSANISMTDLAESLKYAGATMVTYKKELPEVAAAIGTLGNAGIQGSMAGTSLANMLRYLNRSITQEGYKGFKTLHQTLGLTSEDFITSEGNMKSFGEMLGKISEATSQMSSVQRGRVYEDIFGVRGMRAAIALSNDLGGLSHLWTETMDAGGTAAQIMEKRMETLPGAINKVVSAAENLFTKFTIALAPILTKGMDMLASMIDKFGGIFKHSWVAWGILGVTAANKIAIPIIRLSLTIADIRNKGLVTFRSMFTILFSGWKGAALSATEYLNIVTAIKAQSMGLGVPTGLLGTGALRAKTKAYQQVLNNMPAGYFVGNARGGGKGIYQSRSGKPPIFIGRFTDVSGNIATVRGGKELAKGAKWMESQIGKVPKVSSIGGKELAKGAKWMESQIGKVPKVSSIPGMMSHPAGKGLFSAALPSLRGIAAGLFSFLGGPVGIAIMGLSVAIPLIKQAVDRHNDNVVKNNIALAKNAEVTNKLAGRYADEAARMAAGKKLSYEEGLNMINNHLASILKVLQDPSSFATKVVTVGGQEVPLGSIADIWHEYGVKG